MLGRNLVVKCLFLCILIQLSTSTKHSEITGKLTAIRDLYQRFHNFKESYRPGDLSEIVGTLLENNKLQRKLKAFGLNVDSSSSSSSEQDKDKKNSSKSSETNEETETSSSEKEALKKLSKLEDASNPRNPKVKPANKKPANDENDDNEDDTSNDSAEVGRREGSRKRKNSKTTPAPTVEEDGEDSEQVDRQQKNKRPTSEETGDDDNKDNKDVSTSGALNPASYLPSLNQTLEKVSSAYNNTIENLPALINPNVQNLLNNLYSILKSFPVLSQLVPNLDVNGLLDLVNSYGNKTVGDVVNNLSTVKLIQDSLGEINNFLKKILDDWLNGACPTICPNPVTFY